MKTTNILLITGGTLLIGYVGYRFIKAKKQSDASKAFTNYVQQIPDPIGAKLLAPRQPKIFIAADPVNKTPEPVAEDFNYFLSGTQLLS